MLNKRDKAHSKSLTSSKSVCFHENRSKNYHQLNISSIFSRGTPENVQDNTGIAIESDYDAHGRTPFFKPAKSN